METHRFTLSHDALIKVTPWSKTPVRTYEPVDVEILGVIDAQMALMLLTKSNDFSMALELNPEAIDLLIRDLQDVRRRFKKG